MPTIEEGASTVSSSISLVKTIIGAGLLSMPLAYSTDGLIFGTFIIILAALTSGFGLFVQCYVSRYVPQGHSTFFNLCSITYPHLSVIFDIAIAIQCFGCALSYLVLIGDIMPTIITEIPYIQEQYHRLFWLIVSTIIIIPLSFKKNLDSLKYTSVLGLVAIGYMVVLVVSHWVIGDVPQASRGEIYLFPSSLTGVFSTFSIVVFAFTGHQNMFSIVNESKDKSLASLSSLVNFAIVTSAALFIIVGLAGYLTFGDIVDGNVILLYPNGWTTTLGRFCIVFMVVFSFPLMLHPSRISVNNIYYWLQVNLHHQNKEVNEDTALLEEVHEEHFDRKEAHIVPFPHHIFTIITTALLILGYTLAITIKSFAFVLAIVGATGSTAISFILPGLFGYKLIGSELVCPSILERLFKQFSLGLTIWGLVVTVVCLYSCFAL